MEYTQANNPDQIDTSSFIGLLSDAENTLQALARRVDSLETLLNAIYAPIAKGVTNGDSHDHNGGDGAQIAHGNLSSIGTNTHAQIDTALAALATTYAPIAKGVTNGDSHDHNGGDGANIPIAGIVNGVDKTTFTPRIDGTTTAGAGTYTTQTGYYVRIFNVVYFSVNLAWTAHTGTGNMNIEGLPVTSANISLNTPCSVTWSNVTLAAVGNKLLAFVVTNSTQIALREIGSGARANLPLDTAGTLEISGFYFV